MSEKRKWFGFLDKLESYQIYLIIITIIFLACEVVMKALD